VRALVPRRQGKRESPAFRYPLSVVPLTASRFWRRIENRFSRRFYKAAVALAKSFEPTVILNGHVSLGPLSYMLSQKLHVPFVTAVYGVESWGGLWPQDEWALERASALFSISQWTQGILSDRGYDAARIPVVHPIMAPEFEILPPPDPAKTLSKPFTFLTVSRLDSNEQYKGHDHALAAFHRLHITEPLLQWRYIIQGDGSDKKRLQDLTAHHGLQDRVEFHPRVQDRAELEAIFRSADVFLMPSRFGRWEKKWRGEGFGIVYVEAAAFGLPSLAYDCGGATDIILDNRTGWLVDADNVADLARHMEQLIRDPARAHEAGRTAFAHVQKHFTRKNMDVELAAALELV